MSGRSLRVRLWVRSLLSIGVALIVAGLGLVALFERHVERRIGTELKVQLTQLAATVTIDDSGNPALTREPVDPRFSQPLSGLYWQIDGSGEPGLLRSRSLWDAVLELPDDHPEPGVIHAHDVPGPWGGRVLVRERRIQLQGGGQPRVLRLAVAEDAAELTAARNAFAADMLPYLGLIMLVLLLASFVQIQSGLAPLEALRRGVEAIRSGRERQLGETYPDEVMPLVSEVNALLAARAEAVERARAWTADLAHGLKTPLSALSADAQRLREEGSPLLAEDLEQIATTMRRRVERELIRARVRSGAGPHQARVEVVGVLRRLVHTLQRTPDGARLDWILETPPMALAALVPDDLMELLGNLLENAGKWAHTLVRVRVRRAQAILITIEDDGPGVPLEQCSRLGERGLRLDERKQGSGLGLAIVRDVADAYGGEVCFGVAQAGGFLASVRLPPAQ